MNASVPTRCLNKTLAERYSDPKVGRCVAIASLGDEITIPQPSTVPGGAAQATAQFIPWAQARNLTVSPSGARRTLLPWKKWAAAARTSAVHTSAAVPYRRIAMSMLPMCSMLFDAVAAVPSHAHPAASPLLRPARGDWLRHDGADELDRLRVRRIDSYRGLQP